ncbi:uncharacterized protein LOC142621342 isoform X2 [Castanea sativa]|uniref:uncharacterized protein LOC142621342 isoform X2 n=1 Tax=Castanea sativa TaxID=21020 RepID=UPI003F64F9E9
MLCSVPPGKSGSSWLDRLRSNKGFPTTSDDDQNNLDHFLLNHNPNPNPNPNPTDSTRSDSGSTQSDQQRFHRNSTHHQQQQQQQQQHKQMYSLMSNVLSELFFMDGVDGDDHIQSSKLSRKKFPRKQTNPKFLTSTTNTNTNNNNNTSPQYVTTPATASFDSNNSLKEVKENNVEEEEEEEEEKKMMKLKNNKKKEKRELVGYSRSEVTVIDTSFVGAWKSEKVVYRRKNVWKVRSFGRKRKRMNGGCDDDDDNDDDNDDPDDDEYENTGGVLKKMKVSGSESIAGSKEGQNPQNDVREEVYKERTNDLNQVPKKRLPFPRSCGKSRKGGSSVILIKGLPTGKKNGEKVNSKCHKDTQR